MTDRAATFMRDNVTGGLVRSGTTTKSGGLVYRMASGTVYRLSASEAAVLARFNFKPRYVAKVSK